MPPWQIILTVIGGVVAITGLIRLMLTDMKKELRGELGEVRGDLKDMNRRIDGLRDDVHRLDVTVARIEERFPARRDQAPSQAPAE